jgi:drug/metabolite transporter (DMT)-like permease
MHEGFGNESRVDLTPFSCLPRSGCLPFRPVNIVKHVHASTLHPLAGSTVVIAAAALTLGGVAYARGLVVPQTTVGWVSVVFIAVCSTAVAIATFFYGLKYIGPVDASLISTFEPVTTIILASALLGEHITALQVVGIVLILSAVILLARQRAA